MLNLTYTCALLFCVQETSKQLHLKTSLVQYLFQDAIVHSNVYHSTLYNKSKILFCQTHLDYLLNLHGNIFAEALPP